MFRPETEQNTIEGARIRFLDNLRTFMIFLVVLIHAGGVYESSGGWGLFWIVDDPSINHLADILFFIIDIFVMSTMFFISGYTAPMSLEKKNGWSFLQSKIKRLIVPWAIAVLTLIPLYKVIYLYSRNIPQENWTSYFHWNSGIWSQNWLWFLPVLFLFNLLYMPLSKLNCLAEKITVKFAIAGMFFMGIVNSFCVDIFGVRGWTKSPLLDFQNERLAIYFMVFLSGALCFKKNVFASKARSKKLYIITALTAWIPISLYRFFYIKSFATAGNYVFSQAVDTLMLWLWFHLSLLCLLYLSIETFRLYFDNAGAISKELNRNSYPVYIIHTIVLGGIALTMLNTAIPSLLKYFILTVSTYTVCNLTAYCYRKAIKTKILIKRMEVRTMKTVTIAILISVLTIACGQKEEAPAPSISIHLAALQGNIDAIGQHIKAGSNLNEKDAYGSSPLTIAATFGKTEAARMLIEGGADIEITNNKGATPLHIAAFLCRSEIVEMLLDNGADKNAVNNGGRTALETVAGPFEDVKVIYDHLGKGLKQLGLRLDYERIKKTRPQIAEMLRVKKA
ncbi:MAG: acyltransferase family protein [Sedimentisphaerales bacterium]|nr:acyltransferase family protein [Sedimentisphaerales bacterium]